MNYILILKRGENTFDFERELIAPTGLGFIPNRSCKAKLITGSRVVKVDLTPDEATLLANDPRVEALEVKDNKIKVIPQGFPSNGEIVFRPKIKTLNSRHVTIGCVKELQYKEQFESISAQATDVLASIEGLPEGSDVDVVIVDGSLNPNNPEIKDDQGQSRFQQVDWTGSYSKTWGPEEENEHGQHVSGTVCGLNQGWAKKANVYTLYAYDDNYIEYISALKNWHLSKTNGRSTITNHSYGTFFQINLYSINDIRNINSVVINGTTVEAPRLDSGATAVANVSGGQITSIDVVSGGSGYTNSPYVSFYGGGYDEATPVMGFNSVFEVWITEPGAGYDDANPPQVQFSSSPSGETATGKCRVIDGKIFEVIMTNRGSGYTVAPSITFDPPIFDFPGAPGIQATGQTSIDTGFISSIMVTNGGTGHNKWWEFPRLIVSDGGCTKDAAVAWSATGQKKSGAYYVIGKFNGSNWSYFEQNHSSNDSTRLMNSIKTHNGVIYVAGTFIDMDSYDVGSIAKYESGSWRSMGRVRWSGACLEGLEEEVGYCPGLIWDMKIDSQGSIYIAGKFDFAGQSSVKCIAKYYQDLGGFYPIPQGSLGGGLTMNDGSLGEAFSIAIDSSSGAVYVCGIFDLADGVPAKNIAKYHNGEWTSIGDANNPVYSLAVDSQGTVYAGGRFSSMGGVSCPGKIAKYQNGVWSSLAGDLLSFTGTSRISVVALDAADNLYVGGAFHKINNVRANNIAKYSEGAWLPLGGGITLADNCYTIDFDSLGSVYVGGIFNAAGGTMIENYPYSSGSISVSNIAKYYNGSWSNVADSSIETEIVHSVHVDEDDNLYVGGELVNLSQPLKGTMPEDMFQVMEKTQRFADGSFLQSSLGGKFESAPTLSFYYPGLTVSLNNDQVSDVSGDLFGPNFNYTSSPTVVFTNGGGFTIDQLNSWGIGCSNSVWSPTNFSLSPIPMRSAAIDSVTQDLIDAGVVVVAAAGNSSFRIEKIGSPGYDDYLTYRFSYFELSNPSIMSDYDTEYIFYFARGSSPGGYEPGDGTPGVICVGAMDHPSNERIVYFSNFGNRVDIYAPGSYIISSTNFNSAYSIPHPSDPSTYLVKYSGTSMASPQVAGALACYAQGKTLDQLEAITWLNQNSKSKLFFRANPISNSLPNIPNTATNKVLYYPGLNVNYTQSN